MAFKLGSESRGFKKPSIKIANKTPLHVKEMEGTTLAQANMDGSIDIDPSVNPNSRFGRKVIKHEQEHIDQMASGRGAYGDNWVLWEDKIYFRGENEGVKYIDGPNGRWPEGHPKHPWEAEAIAAEDK